MLGPHCHSGNQSSNPTCTPDLDSCRYQMACELRKSWSTTIWHRELCSMLYGCLDGREVWGRMDTWNVRLSSLAIHLKLSQLC